MTSLRRLKPCVAGDIMADHSLPPFLNLSAALREFVSVEGTQSQQHIRPIHKSVAIRLVLEGGFHPGEITPHPPLRSEAKAGRNRLHFDATKENSAEMTVLGGLNQKPLMLSQPRLGWDRWSLSR